MVTLDAEDYARAESMLAPYRKQAVPGASVVPQWLSDGRRFVYEAGDRYVLVDPAAGIRRDAFDHARLAAALSVASGHAVDAADLPVLLPEFEVPGRGDDVVRFVAFGETWEFSGDDGTCARGADRPRLDTAGTVPGRRRRRPDPDPRTAVAPARVRPGPQSYVLRRTSDYLVRHLHGTEPPTHRLTPLAPSLPV